MSAGTGSVKAGEAYVVIGVDTKALEKGLKIIKEKFSAMAKDVAKVGAGFSILGAAITAPILESVKTFSEMGNELDKMSTRTGIGVEALSEIAYAANLAGASMGEFEVGVKKIQKTLIDAANGGEESAGAFMAIGLEVGSLLQLSPEKQFEAVASAIAALPNPAQRAAAAMKLLASAGAGGTQLLPMIQNLAETRAEAQRLGVTMTAGNAKAAATLNDAMDRLGAVLRSIGTVVGATLAPAFTDFSDRLTAAVVKVREFIAANSYLVKIALAVGVAISVIGSALLGAAAVLGSVAAVFAGLSTIVAAIGTALTVLVGIVGALLSPLGLAAAAAVVLGSAIWEGASLGVRAVAYLGEAFGSLSASVTRQVKIMADAFATGGIAQAAKILWLTISLEFQKGMSVINSFWESWVTSIADGFDYIYTAGAQAWEALTNAVTQAVLGWQQIAIMGAQFIGKAYTSIIETLVSATSALIAGAMSVAESVGIVDEGTTAKYEAAGEKLRQIIAAEGQKTSAEYAQQIEQLQAARDAEAGASAGRQAGFAAASAARGKVREDALAASLEKSSAGIDQTQAELAAALKETAQAVKDAPAEGGAPSFVQSLMDSFSAISPSAAATKKQMESVGQFGAAGFQEKFSALFKGNTDKQILSENQKQTGLLAKIADTVGQSQAVFA